MFAINVSDVDEALGCMLVGFYFSYTDKPHDTDTLLSDAERELGIDTVTTTAMDNFEFTLNELGYKFYCPWQDHDGQFIIQPNADYDAECKRIRDEIKASEPDVKE